MAKVLYEGYFLFAVLGFVIIAFGILSILQKFGKLGFRKSSDKDIIPRYNCENEYFVNKYIF
jgi:hypothetical protein